MWHLHTFNSKKSCDIGTCSEIYDSCEFINCDFSSARFSECSFENCDFINCNLSNIIIFQTKFIDTAFNECKLVGITWPINKISSSFSATKCLFGFNVFSGFNLDLFKLSECTFNETFFHDCSIKNAFFDGSDFSGARFEGCNLRKSSFKNCSNLKIDPEINNLSKAHIPLDTALSMLNKYDVNIIG